MANQLSEQLDACKNIHVAADQTLPPTELRAVTQEALGVSNCSVESYQRGQTYIRYNNGDKTFLILLKAVSYLGNPHPIFKKRIQLADWFQDFYREKRQTEPSAEVVLLGVYHYNDCTLFVRFGTETYMQRGLHNSSAHVYINDLYQGLTYGIFEKIDQNGNLIGVARPDKFRAYLLGEKKRTLFDIFANFNSGFPFGKWIYALDAIKYMRDNGGSQWRQTEWAGWLLEFLFSNFLKNNNIKTQIRYIGLSNKKDDDYDFDLHFEDNNFYGDLKASDIKQAETPGNDAESLQSCILEYERFWYVIYEHLTIKDVDRNLQACHERYELLKADNPKWDKGPTSYAARMKNSVRFVKMSIIELNRINYKDVLSEFHQGRQPDGNPRRMKFNIKKKYLNDDNLVVFRYIFAE